MCVFRKIAAMFCAAAIVLSLAGCTGVSVSELYSLPEFSEEHLQLQDLINAEISAGCEYLAPTSGSYRQSVQLWAITTLSPIFTTFTITSRTPRSSRLTTWLRVKWKK